MQTILFAACAGLELHIAVETERRFKYKRKGYLLKLIF